MLVMTAGPGLAYADDAEGVTTGSKSPLERLRLRSAFSRWSELKQRLTPGSNRDRQPTVQQPVLLPVPEPAHTLDSTVDETTNIPVVLNQRAIDDPLIDYFTETAIDKIRPYFDYEPLRVAGQEKDCETICPCADGSDCRKPGGTKPCPCPEDDIKHPWIVKTYTPRGFDEEVFNWNASDVYAYPLYFEDKALERYGHTHCAALQPFLSVRRFGAQLALLPYQMAFKPPLQKRYALGYYRPGEWAPKLHYQIPLNAKAGLVQAGVMTGAFLIFP